MLELEFLVFDSPKHRCWIKYDNTNCCEEEHVIIKIANEVQVS